MVPLIFGNTHMVYPACKVNPAFGSGAHRADYGVNRLVWLRACSGLFVLNPQLMVTLTILGLLGSRG